MGQYDIAAGAFPIFASRNYLNNETETYGTFTTTEMSSILNRIFDGDPNSYWQGSSSSDSTTVTITFTFNNKSAIVSRTIDMIAFLNINWKNFTVKSSSNGVTYALITGLDYSATDYADDDLIVNVTAGIATKYIQIAITTTQVADAKKKLGQAFFTLGTFQATEGYADYQRVLKERGNLRVQIMADGRQRQERLKYSGASSKFIESTFDLVNLTEAQLVLLRTMERDNLPITFFSQPGDVKRDVQHSWISADMPDAYENPLRTAGYRVTVKLTEVGGG